MADDSPAKVWSDQRDIPIYLGDTGDGWRIPFREKWRVPDACAALIGFVLTAALATLDLQSGGTNGLTILVVGAVLTALAVTVLAKLPATRPTLRTRLSWWLGDLRPQVISSHPANPDRGELA